MIPSFQEQILSRTNKRHLSSRLITPTHMLLPRAVATTSGHSRAPSFISRPPRSAKLRGKCGRNLAPTSLTLMLCGRTLPAPLPPSPSGLDVGASPPASKTRGDLRGVEHHDAIWAPQTRTGDTCAICCTECQLASPHPAPGTRPQPEAEEVGDLPCFPLPSG